MYRLKALGGISLEGPSGPETGRIVQRRQLALLALLARSHPTPLTRERAVGILWPESDESRARARLSDALYVIRQALGQDSVTTVSNALLLNSERVWSDVGAFEVAVAEGRLREAVDLYGGPFLDGFYPSDAPDFERWVDGERRSLVLRFRKALETLATEAEEAGDPHQAVGWWRRRAAEEPTNSRVTIRLMRALAMSGNVAGALQHARSHEAFLQEELGLPLPPEVETLVRELAGGTGARHVEEVDLGEGESERGQDRARLEARSTAADAGERPSDQKPAVPLPDPATTVSPASGSGRKAPRRLPVATVALVVLVSGLWLSVALGGDDEAWVRDYAVAEIEDLTRAGLYDSAWTVARRAQRLAPHDRELARLLPEFTWLWPELRTDPPGARVLHRPYGDRDVPWQELGSTPLDTFRLPLGATVLRLEMEGYAPVHMVPDHYLEEFPVLTLDPPDRLPDGMVRVPGWQAELDGDDAELGDFFMDRTPVTNREYLRFVEAGGYRKSDLWTHAFVLAGDTLDWEEAVVRFTDQTGRPGPSTWEGGRYPEGTGEHPVGGVSWYEAAAYAEFAGRSLPGIHHWHRAFGSTFFGEHMVPRSNLHSEGSTPVGAHENPGPFGTYDMAGNVREWTWNIRDEERFIPGAGWDDPDKLALDRWHARHAFDRSAANGFRLVEYQADDPGLEQALAPMEPRPVPDFLAEASPLDDREFEIYRRLFEYDPHPLVSRLEAADTARHWIRETVSFGAGYEGARVLLHLYLPRNGDPPFQTVVYWPGGGARTFRSIDQKTEQHTGFIVQSGRVLAFPVLKGTLERLDEVEDPRPGITSTRYRELTIRRVQDFRRTLDYLESRPDIDQDRFSYFGWSWGAFHAPTMLAIEPRFRAAVLHTAGLTTSRPLPEVDPLNYLPRVDVPVVMINGGLDAVVPFETHAEPFFELLGTPPEEKRLVEADAGHFVPRPLLIRESLDWLDRYVGPVEPG